MIETPRLFVPHPTGHTLKCRTYGIRAMGYDTARYDVYKSIPNMEMSTVDSEFYDFISNSYSMNLSYLPKVRPYVQYVDFMNARGGGIASTDTKAIEYLKNHCNTLIVPNESEREFLEHIFANVGRKSIGGYMFDYDKPIPERFAKCRYVAQVLPRFGITGHVRG